MLNTTINWPIGFQTSLVSVHQGQFEVSNDPKVTLTTVLGSCISVCVCDETNGIGGMNHYLLSGTTQAPSTNLKYGVHAMELLINGLMRNGAKRDQLKAKVFGGAQLNQSFGHIGVENAKFAENFLRDEGIPVVVRETGGAAARRLNYHPVTGQARVLKTDSKEVSTVQEKPTNSFFSNASPKSKAIDALF